MLAGLAAGVLAPAAGARAEAPATSPRPPPRPPHGPAALADARIEAAGLGGAVSYVLIDAASGAVLAARGADQPMPPASTLKTLTAAYALGRLGPDFRFETRLALAGDGGPLVLAGGGDPTLTTDKLADMAATAAAAGASGAAGFGVWDGALPYIAAIDADQPPWLGYNPAVAGLNLNFNRVNFLWRRQGEGFEVRFDAQDEMNAPPVSVARMQVVERESPLFTYRAGGATEDWTVASAGLNAEGSRWLPVRRPGVYAGDVLRALAGDRGLRLPAATPVVTAPAGAVLARHASDGLRAVIAGMLRYSTNITAEAVGMQASLGLGVTSHRASAAMMGQWLAALTGRQGARLVDHSGLGGATRLSAADMAAVLAGPGRALGLDTLMKDVKFAKDVVSPSGRMPQRVVAKTGTLNFVSCLAGYMTAADGDGRIFAIFAADVPRRDAIAYADREQPAGASAWAKRARRLQQEMLVAWA